MILPRNLLPSPPELDGIRHGFNQVTSLNSQRSSRDLKGFSEVIELSTAWICMVLWSKPNTCGIILLKNCIHHWEGHFLTSAVLRHVYFRLNPTNISRLTKNGQQSYRTKYRTTNQETRQPFVWYCDVSLMLRMHWWSQMVPCPICIACPTQPAPKAKMLPLPET